MWKITLSLAICLSITGAGMLMATGQSLKDDSMTTSLMRGALTNSDDLDLTDTMLLLSPDPSPPSSPMFTGVNDDTPRFSLNDLLQVTELTESIVAEKILRRFFEGLILPSPPKVTNPELSMVISQLKPGSGPYVQLSSPLNFC
jgi:hypothetical protein